MQSEPYNPTLGIFHCYPHKPSISRPSTLHWEYFTATHLIFDTTLMSRYMLYIWRFLLALTQSAPPHMAAKTRDLALGQKPGWRPASYDPAMKKVPEGFSHEATVTAVFCVCGPFRAVLLLSAVLLLPSSPSKSSKSLGAHRFLIATGVPR
jgi:hypothetical protein